VAQLDLYELAVELLDGKIRAMQVREGRAREGADAAAAAEAAEAAAERARRDAAAAAAPQRELPFVAGVSGLRPQLLIETQRVARPQSSGGGARTRARSPEGIVLATPAGAGAGAGPLSTWHRLSAGLSARRVPSYSQRLAKENLARLGDYARAPTRPASARPRTRAREEEM